MYAPPTFDRFEPHDARGPTRQDSCFEPLERRSSGHTLVAWSFDVPRLLDEVGNREVQAVLAGSDSIERARPTRR